MRYRKVRWIRYALITLVLLGMVFCWWGQKGRFATPCDDNEQLGQGDRQQRGKENASFVMLVR